MNNGSEQTFSVASAADICNVGQSTVGYWIRSKGLPAEKAGKGYAIALNDLVFFLKSAGRKVPPVLENRCSRLPYFKPFRHCWDFLDESHHSNNCSECVVFLKKLNVCFSAKESSQFKCKGHCRDCAYYLDTFFPKIQFIHQLEVPAAVCEGLYFWGWNRQWETAFLMAEEDFPGTGIEKIVHPDSIATVLAFARKRNLEDCDIPRMVTVHFLGKQCEKVPVKILGISLEEPRGCSLVIAERQKTPLEKYSTITGEMLC